MFTPAGPIIMSSASMPGIDLRAESARLIDVPTPDITGLAGVLVESILGRVVSGFFF
jgi:hypothetical protein